MNEEEHSVFGSSVALAIDLEMAARFLGKIDPAATSWNFRTLNDRDPDNRDAHLFRGSLGELAETLIAENQLGRGVFVMINDAPGGHKAADVTRIRAAYIDLDGAPLEPVMHAEIPPHVVNETSPGKYHCYWKLSGVPVDCFQTIERPLIERFGADRAVKDVGRILRVPGFYHHKSEPHLVRTVHMADHSALSYDDIQRGTGPRQNHAEHRGHAPNQQARGRGADDPESALRTLVDRVRNAPVSTRNNTLNTCACILGRLVASDQLDRNTVQAELTQAALDAGLDEGEIQSTIQSGLGAGIEAGPETPADEQLRTQIVDTLNERHASIMVSGAHRVLNFEGSDGEYSMSRKADFFDRYAGTPSGLYNANGRPLTVAEVWWSSPARRQYEGFVFRPGEPPEIAGYLNEWRGWPIEPEQGDCSLYKRLVREAICAGDQETFLYVWSYLAHMIQKPGELPGTALILRGGQGAGKNSFVEPLKQLVGPRHYIELSSTSRLTGRFNSHLSGRLLVFSNEATFPGDRAADGLIKAMVTDRDEIIERKGVDTYTARNCKRLIAASNNELLVGTDVDDRRYLMLEVSDVLKQEPGFFAALYRQMDRCGLQALMYELQNFDISNFDASARPVSAANRGMILEHKLARLSPADLYLYEILQRGGLVDPSIQELGVELWPTEPSCDALYRDFKGFCRQQNLHYGITRETLGKHLKRALDVNRVRPRREGRRAWCYAVPPLIEARHRFENYLGHEVEWDTMPAAPELARSAA